MIIAQPSECPGIQVRSATNKLYIGSYTRVVIADLNDPGSETSIEIVRSHEGDFIVIRYFPICVEKSL